MIRQIILADKDYMVIIKTIILENLVHGQRIGLETVVGPAF